MRLITGNYSAVRLQIQNGDDCFFRKRKVRLFSIHWFIQLISWVHHCEKFIWTPNFELKSGRMVEVEPTLCLAGMDRVKRYNSKKKKMVKKVEFTIRSAKKVIDEYPGKVYWSPLSLKIRQIFNDQRFCEQAHTLKGTGYDYFHLIPAGVDDAQINWLQKKLRIIATVPGWVFYWLKKLMKNSEDYTKLICSEANGYLDKVSFGLEGNMSEQTPDDQAQQATHDNVYNQFKGRLAEIPKFNTVKVKWSVK